MFTRYTLYVTAAFFLVGLGWPLVVLATLGTLSASKLVDDPKDLAFASAPNTVPGEALSTVELDCLALNIYHEARGEPAEGQLAVAHVVLNRATDQRFPDHVCDVVKDGGEEILHRCQFSWWCDGRSDRPADTGAWQTSRQMALAALTGSTPDPTYGALWYHADYVQPYWAAQKTLVTSIGRHIFYLD